MRRRPATSRFSFRISRTSVWSGASKICLLEIVEAILELLDLGPIVIDHGVDDAMEQRDRAFTEDLRYCGVTCSRSSLIDRGWPSCTVTR